MDVRSRVSACSGRSAGSRAALGLPSFGRAASESAACLLSGARGLEEARAGQVASANSAGRGLGHGRCSAVARPCGGRPPGHGAIRDVYEAVGSSCSTRIASDPAPAQWPWHLRTMVLHDSRRGAYDPGQNQRVRPHCLSGPTATAVAGQGPGQVHENPFP